MSTIMEPKKFASFMEDDTLSFVGHDDDYPLPSPRPQSPSLSGRLGLRRSAHSSRSGSVSPDMADATVLSCVARETSTNDCATQRFIVWAAVRRNACNRMTENERLECPLLRCTRRFPDHESMLRHLIKCELLSSCEYWCYDHMRLERFDDSRCKKCLGHPSKRRKMLLAAKNFFTGIGHNKGKAVVGGGDPVSPMSPFAPASAMHGAVSPISSDLGSDHLNRSGSNGSSSSRYSNGSSYRSNSSRSAGHFSSRGSSYRQPGNLHDASASSASLAAHAPPPPRYEDINQAVHVELPSTEIVEIDSREVSLPPQPMPSTVPIYANNGAYNPGPADGVLPMVARLFPLPSVAPVILPVVAPTPPPPCPTPPAASMAPPPVPNETASVNPMELYLPELDSTAVPSTGFGQWQSIASAEHAISDILNTVDPSNISLEQFIGFQGHDSVFYPPESDASMKPALHLNTFSQLQKTNQEMQAAQPVPSVARPQRPTSTSPAPRSKNLSPSSSVRSTTSTTSTTSTASATSIMSDVSDTSCMSNATSIISPISDCSHGTYPWSTAPQTTLTSPTDDFSDLFGDDLFSAKLDASETAGEPAAALVPDVPADIANPFDCLSGDALLFPFDASLAEPLSQQQPATDASFTTQANAEPDVDNAFDDAEELFPEAQDIVASAQDLLFTHVMTSLTKLRDIDCDKNALAQLFQNASLRQIMDTGAQALQMALATGNEIMAPFDTLCFLHLIYAFSLVTYEAEAALRSSALFTHSLKYALNFGPLDRDNYLEIVSLIWQPRDMSAAELSDTTRALRQNPIVGNLLLSPDNMVVNTAKAFLDDLELSAILGPESDDSDVVKTSALFSLHFGAFLEMHNSQVFASQACSVIVSLLRYFSSAPGMSASLEAVCRQAIEGSLDSVRWLEIKLLHAGRISLGSSAAYFDDFVPRTRTLCDAMYNSHIDASPQRSTYYDGSISLMRTIFDSSENVHLAQGMAVSASMLDSSLLADDLLSAIIADSSAVVAGSRERQKDDASIEEEPSEPKAPAVAKQKDDQQASTTQDKVEVESDDCCELCGYRPKGHPKWFRGSMAKHKQTKHSAEVIYKCPFPGCNSQYRNRADNLRQHQLEKNHFVGDEATGKKAKKQKRKQQAAKNDSDEMSEHPAKRAKTVN